MLKGTTAQRPDLLPSAGRYDRVWRTRGRSRAPRVQEEIAAELTEVRYLGTLENIFTYEGIRGHEIVLVYDGRLADFHFYEKESFQGDEVGNPFKAVWKWLDEFGPGKPPLYPDGLMELV